jgi:hypothetical protein
MRLQHLPLEPERWGAVEFQVEEKEEGMEEKQ